MASQIGTVNGKTSKVPLEEPALKLNMEEFCELKKLETAGDIVGVQDLKKRVRQRMESEPISSGSKTSTSTTTSTTTATATTSKKSKLITATASTLNTNGDKKMVANQKRLEISKNPPNTVSNEDKKKEKFKLTSKSTSESLTAVKKEKNVTNKEKLKSSSLDSKNFSTNNGVGVHNSSSSSSSSSNNNNNSNLSSRKPVKSTSTSTKDSSFNSFLKNEKNFVKSSKHSTINNNNSSRKNVKQSAQKFEMYVEQWKLKRERGDKYMPLELFLPPNILNDKDQMVTVQKIAKEFELNRLRRLLEKDKEKLNGDKKLAQQRIEDLNNFGSNYTRLEIAAFRNDRGPKKEQQIRAHITFLNEKNIIKHKKLNELDVIEEPYYLKKCAQQFQEQQQKIKQNKEKLLLQRKGMVEKQKVLERKRKPEESLVLRRHEKLDEERKRKLQFLERKGEGRLSEQKRHQMSTSEMKRRQEKIVKTELLQRRIEDLRSERSSSIGSNNKYAPKKMMTDNKNGTSTSLKKRTFDERSEVAPSRAPKRRNFGNKELDICRMDTAEINRNMSSIIHDIFRRGRKPMRGMGNDDDDDDVMEVSGFELFREEARSTRLAKKEDEDEERAERMRKLNKKKA